MSRFQNFVQSVKSFFAPTQTLKYNDRTNEPKFTPQYGEKGSTLIKLAQHYKYRAEAEMQGWRDAVAIAENPIRPDRKPLYAIYRTIETDAQVETQTRIAKYTVLRAPFAIYPCGNETDAPNKEKTDFFKRLWFDDFLAHSVDTEFWGHSLIEFEQTLNDKKEFTKIDLLPREHVRPEYQDILISQSDTNGIPYKDVKIENFLIEMGKPFDLGLFEKVSLPTIRKTYAETDWSRRSERFGAPLLAIKTQSRDAKEIAEKKDFAQNFGANGFVILRDSDEVTMIEPSSAAGGHNIYADRIKMSDEQIAKIINGQTSSSDEKSFVGAAEVHERILNNFTFARLRRIQYHINSELIPFLIAHGYPLEGFEFRFEELTEQDEEAEPLDQDPKAMPTDKGTKKKSPNPNQKLSWQGLVAFQKLCLDFAPHNHHAKPELTLAFDDALQSSLIQDVFNGHLKLGDFHSDLWQHNVSALWKAVGDGADEDLSTLNSKHRDFELHKKLRQNVWDFSAHKVHRNISDLIDLKKKHTSFTDFESAAKNVLGLYNKHWLKVEADTATASTQMAIQWADFQHFKEDFPNLRYVTSKDERVRPGHRKLHGVTLPMDDEFWDKYYPPIGYRCRCTVQQLGETKHIRPSELPTDQEVPPVFQYNAGKLQTVFPPKHPYFKSGKPADVAKFVESELVKIPIFDTIFEAQKGMVQVHSLEEPSSDEQAINVDIATEIAKDGHIVKLLPYFNALNRKNPDATIDDKITDFKTIGDFSNLKSAIQHAIRSAAKQNAAICMIDIRHLNIDVAMEKLIEYGMKAGTQQGFNKSITEIWLMRKGVIAKILRTALHK